MFFQPGSINYSQQGKDFSEHSNDHSVPLEGGLNLILAQRPKINSQHEEQRSATHKCINQQLQSFNFQGPEVRVKNLLRP